MGTPFALYVQSILKLQSKGTGEINIRLDPKGLNDLQIWRLTQDDLAISIDCKKVEGDIPDALSDLLQKVVSGNTIRTYSFHSPTGKSSPFLIHEPILLCTNF